MRHVYVGFGALLLCTALSSPSQAQISTFTSNDEGWQVVSFGDLSTGNYSVVGTYTPTYNITGGNPGGYIRSTDLDSGEFTFSAPSTFLGNQTGKTTLSYDLLYLDTVNYQTTDVMLTGNGERLLWESNPPFVPGATWSTVNVSLAPSSNWLVGSPAGNLATAADFANVLGNLTGIYIRGEYAIGPDDTGLDNVNFGPNTNATPEPGSIALFVAGSLTGATFLRRRKARKSA